MQITEKVKEIKDFLKNCEFDDPNKQFMRPLPKRQRICFDLGISELLVELLFYLKTNRDGKINENGVLVRKGSKLFQSKPNEKEKLIQMYNAIY